MPVSSHTGWVFGKQPCSRSCAAAVVVVLLVLLFGHSGTMHSEPHAPHPPHALLSSLGGEASVNTNHAHLLNGESAHFHNEIATAVLPRSLTTLVQLGVPAAFFALTAMLASLVAPAGRGPPRPLASTLVGQDISTRFCVARR